jgi:S-adenosylmethionine:tRNA ribosyltransferase-isomerase
MLARLAQSGVRQLHVTLHVGVDTFRPVRAEHAEDHEMHGEVAALNADVADAINAARGRIVAVGTTSVRTLESAHQQAVKAGARGRRVEPFHGETRLFITPGYRFGAVDAMLTNFHLPRSTLLMLVSAFAGCEAVRHAYRVAIENRYRFFSFGDAMLIL